MAEELKLEKGARVAIVAGRKGAGVRGEIFWIGENKYGPGMRYGVRGDDAETYWVDEASLGPESAAPAPPPRQAKPPLAKGARVEIVKGRDKGKLGEVFWVGESKFGVGMRYGVRGDDEETYWVDEQLVEPSDAPPPEGQRAEGQGSGDQAPPRRGGSSSGRDAAPIDDAPFPDDAAFGDDAAADADPFDDDIPFPGDDVPF